MRKSRELDNMAATESSEGHDSSTCSLQDAGSIQAIDRESVHRICSGQVVLTLATAVKELVENSIDAGATFVDIKLKECGSENIEVSDNGLGVEEKNFIGLTQKHHTSKLSDFSDLVSVETFGFRGEALSSLCALSHMTITTRHKSVAVGTRLEYDNNGQILSKTPTPRQQGTTVCLQNLFHTLPVRHKEFQRNLKKEFSKMVQTLNAYCLINTGVRITCSNQTSKGSRSTVVSTNGNCTVKDNIANIFGPKQLQSLLPFEQRSPTEDVCADYGIQSSTRHTDLFSMEGYVSKCEHGKGRSSTDRQFLFINRRPCDASKILKTINEVYHTYNRHQYPFVVLLITMAKESVDVNVTPDKRQIFMEGEKLLLATIKTSLIKMFEPTTSVLKMNLVPHQSSFSVSRNDSKESSVLEEDSPSKSSVRSPQNVFQDSHNCNVEKGLSSLARLKRSFSSAFDKTDHSSMSTAQTPQLDKQRKIECFLNKSHSTPARFSPDKGSIKSFFSRSASSSSSAQNVEIMRSCSSDKPVVVNVDDNEPVFSSTVEHVTKVETGSGFRKDTGSVNTANDLIEGVELNVKGHCSREVASSAGKSDCDSQDFASVTEEHIYGSHQPCDCGSDTCVRCKESSQLEKTLPTELDCKDHGGHGVEDKSAVEDEVDSSSEASGDLVRESSHFKISSCQKLEGDTLSGPGGVDERGARDNSMAEVEDLTAEAAGSLKDSAMSFTVTQLDNQDKTTRRECSLPFSFQKLRECLTSPEMTSQRESEKGFSRSFRAKICPTDNSSAEEELQREISKDMFSKMDVLGQFNLGFIIARNGDDLFIVDQHATDEKYNFEMLQRHTVIQSQQLIRPLSLELTASNEVILMDNLDIFTKNGFDFVVDEEAPPTQRVKLKSTPVSKNWNFGKDDIEELIFMLTDSPGIMCRPSRVRMMFASRACRKSIMIGTHLNKSEMRKLLCHMGEIEQPWNCPHGRPTMRHLINLRMLSQ